MVPETINQGSASTVGRTVVLVERTRDLEVEHQFRAGKTVRLYAEQAGAAHPERTGVVHWGHKNRMHILLNVEDLPEWLGLGQLGVDLLFDETTYQEMEKALDAVLHARQGRLAGLRDILLGEGAARFREASPSAHVAWLNDSQNQAGSATIGAADFYRDFLGYCDRYGCYRTAWELLRTPD